MYKKTLHTYLKNKKKIDGSTASRTITYLLELLDFTKEDFKKEESKTKEDEKKDSKRTLNKPALYILGELVYDYYYNPPNESPFKELSDFERKAILRYARNIHLDSTAGDEARNMLPTYNRETIFDVFMYFIKSPLWREYEYYDSDEELYDILEYLNRYSKILTIWLVCGSTYPNHEETIHYSYTKYFSLALYHKLKLPWESDFNEEDVDYVEVVLKDNPLYDIEEIKRNRKAPN